MVAATGVVSSRGPDDSHSSPGAGRRGHYRRPASPARERYELLTGAPRPVADFVLSAYQVDAALARTAAATRPEIPPEVVDLVIAGQRGQAAARYCALKAVSFDAAVAVLDTFPRPAAWPLPERRF
jgi:hypothetical protein